MKTSLLVLSMFLGVVLTVHLAMNGMVGAAINNPRVGNAVFWCIGAVRSIRS
jgi:bacterial/archaeal transporter family-2 protein